jgi:hypothetical protein
MEATTTPAKGVGFFHHSFSICEAGVFVFTFTYFKSLNIVGPDVKQLPYFCLDRRTSLTLTVSGKNSRNLSLSKGYDS